MDVGAGGHFVVDVDDLENKLSRVVVVKAAKEFSTALGVKNIDEDARSKKIEPCGPDPAKKCLDKFATFPCSSKKLTCVVPFDGEGEEDEPETGLRMLFSDELYQSPCARLPSFPLVSAMKGSREKQGSSPRTLTVKWAPDVYDPIPNSVSHSVKSKQKKSRDRDNHKYKKKGKKGQKGNSSRANGVKDKKQNRRAGGKSEKGHKTLDAIPSADIESLGIASPDNCGSSFLKESVTKFHYSIAEAS